MIVLTAHQIHKSYTDTQKRVDVLKGIDVEVHTGESIAIVGPSGAGKSTLLHILGGLDAPDRGKVFLAGRDLYKLHDRDRAAARNAEVGFVFQFYHLLPELTALENALLPLLIASHCGRPTGDMLCKAGEALAAVGLSDRADHKPNQLSGGEQQRVAIARALINDPKVVFCDEPTGNLDSVSGEGVVGLLMSLSRDQGRTIVIVTHDEGLAASCSRVVSMKDGILLKSSK